MPAGPYDVAVIGAGVVGAAVARELCRYELRIAILEGADDVGTGTSKANTAIWHTGFDAQPGSLEAALLRRSHPLLERYAAEAGVPFEKTGALLVAWNEDELALLPEVETRARANGYLRTRRLSAQELARREPHLGPGARGAIEVPDEGILCPFTTPLALASEAVLNGASLFLRAPVQAARREGALHVLTTPRGDLAAAWVVNAAGLHADEVDRLFGHETFTIVPRRGELIVFDKLARRLLSHVILPVPTQRTKGVLVAPTVFGNVLLGPTAEDVDDKTATATTAAGIARLLEAGRRILPPLLDEEVTATYAGLRAATEIRDYRIEVYPGERYACVGGIRSTGLSACLGIAEHVRERLEDAGLALRLKRSFRPVRMPPVGESARRPHEDDAAIAADPDHGRIVCHCERVSRAEILAACRAPIPARSLDGLRRRTRALFGRCQGFFCAEEVTRLLVEASGTAPATLLGLADPPAPGPLEDNR
ncbi:MAG TPA: NAD(P)/FAD-dependent oxidoreductase [Actinomycetota bacterium]|nr:NAD(P)/FAD-dependent oxidoreductase [Actinomycetota bacterium]